jgi:ClpP class serine protease
MSNMSAITDIMNNIWILLLVVTLVLPKIQQTYLQRARSSVLSQLGKRRKTNIITMIHRQETMSLLGVPIARYIDLEDSEAVLRAIRLTPEDQDIDVIMHTPGGIALAATQIAFALKAHKGKTTVIVPHYAMSGGTLIALAADEILMDPHAVLGPVDPQLGTQKGSYAAASVLRTVEKKKPDDLDDETLYLAEESRMAIQQMKETVRKLIEDKYDEETTNKIVENLVSGKYTHDYPITAETTCDLLGRCAITGIPKEVYSLMNLYQMAKPQRPGIEYVPRSKAVSL